MKILVVFGSASDENVSLPLVQSLSKEKGFDVEYQVISAHRNLEQLQEKIANWKGDTIVAGAGGDDAEDFARMLVEMYQRFCEGRGWNFIVVDRTANDHNCYRNITLEVTGKEAYGTFLH